MRKKTTIQFIEELVDKNIPYTLLGEYEGDSVRIEFRCPLGHDFLVSPNNVLRGRGCSVCRLNNLSIKYRTSKEKYIEQIRNQGYEDEVLGDYINQKTKLLHKCINGHEYEALPLNMTRGLGSCSYCDKLGMPHKLYYIKIGKYYKIGITRKTIAQRFMADKSTKAIKVLLIKEFSNFTSAKKIESKILKKYKEFSINTDKIKYLKSSGDSELFIKDIIGIENVGLSKNRNRI